MADFDDDIEDNEETKKTKLESKKILIFLLPVLIVIGATFGVFYFFISSEDDAETNYQSVSISDGKDGVSTIIFYDLPEIAILLQNEKNSTLKVRMNIEISSIEDIPTIEAMMPRIKDMIISHTIALRPEEISGSRGMYWLKEEFLKRINILIAPIKVNNLNFKNFEFIENNQ